MGFLSRIFGNKKSADADRNAADRSRAGELAGRATAQSADEQAASRTRMEAELDAQRDKRGQPTKPDA